MDIELKPDVHVRAVYGNLESDSIHKGSVSSSGRCTHRHQAMRAIESLRRLEISWPSTECMYTSLQSVMRVVDKSGQALCCDERRCRRDVKTRVIDVLEKVRISDPETVARLYPYQIFGGLDNASGLR